MKKTVIFDIGNPNIKQNKLFDKDFAYKISHTLIPLCFLHDEAKKIGIDFITPDIFLDNLELFKNKKVYLMSHLVNPNTEKLISLGVKPLLLTCQESPFIATRFYINLRKYSSLFMYSMLFPGMKKMTSDKTIFIPMFFPEFISHKITEYRDYKDKKFLTYIGSNKEIKNILRTFLIKLLYGYKIKMVYSARKKIIKYLSRRDDFDLYGRGWGSEKDSYIKKVYRGEISNKEEKLREYKFVLCLENAIFPSYITEKIFDCFFAGSVPVYLGASDISKYIPKNTFINIQDFKNMKDLEKFLDSIDKNTYKKYLKNIKDFLNSNAYKKYDHKTFIKNVISLIQSAN